MGWPIMPKDAVHCLVLYEKARAIAPDFEVYVTEGMVGDLLAWRCTWAGKPRGTGITIDGERDAWAQLRDLLGGANVLLEGWQLDQAAACVRSSPPMPGRCSPIAYGPDDVRARYRRDPVFRSIVDMLHERLHSYEYTPTELREALMLASTIHVERCGFSDRFFFPVPR